MENESPPPPPADVKRRRLTRAERELHLASWKRSGLSGPAYARAEPGQSLRLARQSPRRRSVRAGDSSRSEDHLAVHSSPDRPGAARRWHRPARGPARRVRPGVRDRTGADGVGG